MSGYWISYLLLIVIASFSDAQDPELIKQLTHGGKVRGQRKLVQVDGKQISINVFHGIPFAQPPVGVRRFAPPQKHPGWSGIRNATRLPPACWQYILEGFDKNNPAARMWLNNTEMSEDCLYLNIWTPSYASPTNLLPVMVWIYGGGYTSGTSTLDVYDASVLVAKHKVIVLSMQYRVGALGFLRLDPDSGAANPLPNGVPNANSVARGNQGLLDQQLALEWMHENIAEFGGNPKHVTVFGESSGAVSASIQWLSPLAQRYFQRVILQSGSVYARWALDSLGEAHMRGQQFAVACGCTSPSVNREASLKCLQSLHPITLVDNLDSVAEFVGQRRRGKLVQLFEDSQKVPDKTTLLSWAESSRMYFDVPFKAVVDGYVIPKQPEQMFSPNFHTSLRRSPELLLGVNKNEAMYFLLYGLALGNGSFLHEDGSVLLPEAIQLAAARRPQSPNGPLADFHRISSAQFLSEDQLVRGISQLPSFSYGLPVDTSQTNGYADPSDSRMTAEALMHRLDTLCGELDFICPTLNFAEQVARIANSKVFLYEMQRKTLSCPFPSWTGVMHGYEIEYVFGMPYSEKFQNSFYRFNVEEKKLSDEMMRMWTNFAKRGDPNRNDDGTIGAVVWPAYKAAKQRDPALDLDDYIILDTPIRRGKDLRQAGCRFWLHEIPTLVKERRSMDDNGSSCNDAITIFSSRAIIVVIFFSVLPTIHYTVQ
ncbi:hypothetical protein T265_05062 [Opisthorchis viverrini]|uniref:Carboxylesterase type B domain-containing protein n=3 Tax=Opisthorchis viverrini TaxID=6198 RepID=A0A074ZLQ9_OPIVI|nr:hypothetical protein T265_05062 [Opisthorchis viverrini]KER28016.1 hypothetical protein T265_05062 [Opisthorchis viverrini]